MDNRAFVVTPDIFPDVMKQFLSKLKEKGIVKDFNINIQDRVIVIFINEEAGLPTDAEDVISNGLFRNIKAILEDLGYDEIKDKIVQLPVYSVQEDKNKLIINY